MHSSDVRRTFLSFFEKRGHTIVPSATLIPPGDPTLMFVNAGMVPFKDVFLGKEPRSYTRAASCQRCLRVSGKHNDLEEVGPSPQHQTFFEMLGNFSFGDYFKDEALAFWWELLTKDFDLPPEKLHPTVYEEDDESAEIWSKLTGRPAGDIVRLGAEDNFWSMGDTGPCGPNSEVIYDRTGKCLKDGSDCFLTCDCDRWWELGNNVFMQFDRAADGTLTPLPKNGVDTGMGLDRMTSVLQDVPSNYENDLFAPLIEKLQGLTGDREISSEGRPAYRAVADHARAMSFLITDGVLPSNEGRGYVLRRILRRASYQGRLIGLMGPFLSDICRTAIDLLAEPYPELREAESRIMDVVSDEEERFLATLDRGISILNGMVEYRKRNQNGTGIAAEFALQRRPAAENSASVLAQHGFEPRASRGEDLAAVVFERRFHEALEAAENGQLEAAKAILKDFTRLEDQVSAEEAFLLYDTYGFPIDLTRKALEARGWRVDEAGFERALEEQRERGRAALGQERQQDEALLSAARELDATEFLGYDTLLSEGRVVALFTADGRAQEAAEGAEVQLVLDATPFYAEGGGQVGDAGTLRCADCEIAVDHVRRVGHGVFVHGGRVTRGLIREGESMRAEVDALARANTMRNHTATHLLHKALRVVLGPQAKQAGSLVAPGRLRFDFYHSKPLTDGELQETERIVREQVLLDRAVHTDVMPTQEALSSGADAMFDEKYGESARVVIMGDDDEFSRELCGGTHCAHTGEVGAFFIVEQRSVGAGVRRVEAVTGLAAYEWADARRRVVEELSREYNVPAAELPERLRALQERAKAVPKAAAARLPDPQQVLANAEQRNGTYYVIDWIEAADAETLRNFADAVRRKAKSAAVIVGSEVDGKLNYVIALTEDLVAEGKDARQWGREIGSAMGGGGGGPRKDMANAGGDPARRDAGLEKARELTGVS